MILLGCIAGYVLVLAYIRTYKPFPRFITLYGPIIGLKTDQVGFFDYFRRYSGFLRIYGSIGVAMVVIVSVAMVVMLLLSVNLTLELKPEPTPLHKPQNIFLIPGINEFVPSTFAVWFLFTLVIHEFGHAILCRVEQIAVKAWVVSLMIPIGAFVEPDEDEVKKASSWPRMRMYELESLTTSLSVLSKLGLMVSLIGWQSLPRNRWSSVFIRIIPRQRQVFQYLPSSEPSMVRWCIPAGRIRHSNGTRPGDTVIVGFDKG